MSSTFVSFLLSADHQVQLRLCRCYNLLSVNCQCLGNLLILTSHLPFYFFAFKVLRGFFSLYLLLILSAAKRNLLALPDIIFNFLEGPVSGAIPLSEGISTSSLITIVSIGKLSSIFIMLLVVFIISSETSLVVSLSSLSNKLSSIQLSSIIIISIYYVVSSIYYVF